MKNSKVKKVPRTFNAKTGLKFIVYVDAGGGFRWRLLAKNNRTIADSGESYTLESHARDMIALIKGASGFAKVSTTRYAPGTHGVPALPPVHRPAGTVPGVGETPAGQVPHEPPFTGNPSPG